MKKRYLPFTVPSWTKWILLATLVLAIASFSYGYYLYQGIMESKAMGFKTSRNLALTETELSTAESVTRYHGDIYYHVVKGTTQNGEAAIVYVPIDTDSEADNEKVLFFNAEHFLSQEEIVRIWRNNCDSCELVGANLAIDREQPLWEIKYIDNKDRYVFEYFYIEDGTSYEHFRLRRSLY